MAREEIPITPEVLTWARERAHFSVEEARERFKNIEAWERGETFPTYPQLERISDTFNVPIALFFFPQPPEVPPINESFRTIQGGDFDKLPRRIHYMLRKAQSIQINLYELNDGQNPAENFILNNEFFTPDTEISVTAQRVRDFLSISLETQISWEDSDVAFKSWRNVLEDHGVAVFKDAFRDEDFSGFCLYDAKFPLIYINNSVKTRQIFTLFHELAHLLWKTSGVDVIDSGIREELNFDDHQVEVICNKFASEFLLPQESFEVDFQGYEADENTATMLAERYHVSRELIYRRFLDKALITQEEYLNASRRWISQRQTTSSGNYYWTKVTYLGTNYLRLAFSQYYKNKISESELADYLDTKVVNLSKLENYLARSMANVRF